MLIYQTTNSTLGLDKRIFFSCGSFEKLTDLGILKTARCLRNWANYNITTYAFKICMPWQEVLIYFSPSTHSNARLLWSRSHIVRTNTSWMCRAHIYYVYIYIYMMDVCIFLPCALRRMRGAGLLCLGVSRCFIYNFIIIVRAWWMHWHLNAFVQQKWVYIKKWRD